MTENLSDWDKNILECLETHKKKEGYEGNFYLVVLTKKEKLMQNVLRNYFFATKSCPSPVWDQTVYQYNRANDELVFLWTIPDKATCFYFNTYKDMIKPEEMTLLKFVLDFEDGSLLRHAQKLNNETITPPVIKLQESPFGESNSLIIA